MADTSPCAHFCRTGRIPLRSANLLELGYDPGRRELIAVFVAAPGTAYVYSHVSTAEWIGLWMAESVGREFNRTIRRDRRGHPYARRKL